MLPKRQLWVRTWDPSQLIEAKRAAKAEDTWMSRCLLCWLMGSFLTRFQCLTLTWVCHSRRFASEVPPLGLLSLASRSPSVVKWYVNTRVFSHWRICSLLSSQTTHLRGPSENHWKIVLPRVTLVLLGLPFATLLPPYFSFTRTERLKFYKSYIHKTFFFVFELMRDKKGWYTWPSQDGKLHLRNELTVLKVGTWAYFTMKFRWEGRFREKIKRSLPIGSGPFLSEGGPDQSPVPLLWLFLNWSNLKLRHLAPQFPSAPCHSPLHNHYHKKKQK